MAAPLPSMLPAGADVKHLVLLRANCGPDQLFKTLFASADFQAAFHKLRNDSGYRESPWVSSRQELPQPQFSWELPPSTGNGPPTHRWRKNRFESPPAAMASKPFQNEELLCCTEFAPGNRYVVETQANTTAPYGSNFNIFFRTSIVGVDGGAAAVLLITHHVDFLPSMSRMLKPVVAKGIDGGVRGTYKQLRQTLETFHKCESIDEDVFMHANMASLAAVREGGTVHAAAASSSPPVMEPPFAPVPPAAPPVTAPPIRAARPAGPTTMLELLMDQLVNTEEVYAVSDVISAGVQSIRDRGLLARGLALLLTLASISIAMTAVAWVQGVCAANRGFLFAWCLPLRLVDLPDSTAEVVLSLGVVALANWGVLQGARMLVAHIGPPPHPAVGNAVHANGHAHTGEDGVAHAPSAPAAPTPQGPAVSASGTAALSGTPPKPQKRAPPPKPHPPEVLQQVERHRAELAAHLRHSASVAPHKTSAGHGAGLPAVASGGSMMELTALTGTPASVCVAGPAAAPPLKHVPTLATAGVGHRPSSRLQQQQQGQEQGAQVLEGQLKDEGEHSGGSTDDGAQGLGGPADQGSRSMLMEQPDTNWVKSMTQGLDTMAESFREAWKKTQEPLKALVGVNEEGGISSPGEGAHREQLVLGAGQPHPAHLVASLQRGDEDDDIIVEEVFENERFQPFRGWGHLWPGHFLPSDKVGHWSKRDGSPGGPESMDMKQVAPDLPYRGKWKWLEDEWQLDRDGNLGDAIDAEGWCYALDFPFLKWPPAPGSGKCTMNKFVRRRRFTRTRVRIEPRGGLKPAAASAAPSARHSSSSALLSPGSLKAGPGGAAGVEQAAPSSAEQSPTQPMPATAVPTPSCSLVQQPGAGAAAVRATGKASGHADGASCPSVATAAVRGQNSSEAGAASAGRGPVGSDPAVPQQGAVDDQRHVQEMVDMVAAAMASPRTSAPGTASSTTAGGRQHGRSQAQAGQKVEVSRSGAGAEVGDPLGASPGPVSRGPEREAPWADNGKGPMGHTSPAAQLCCVGPPNACATGNTSQADRGSTTSKTTVVTDVSPVKAQQQAGPAASAGARGSGDAGPAAAQALGPSQPLARPPPPHAAATGASNPDRPRTSVTSPTYASGHASSATAAVRGKLSPTSSVLSTGGSGDASLRLEAMGMHALAAMLGSMGSDQAPAAGAAIGGGGATAPAATEAGRGGDARVVARAADPQ